MTVFNIAIQSIKTTAVGEMQNVIKEVSWILSGEQEGHNFELPQTTILPDPSQEEFIVLENVTEEEVIVWIEDHHPNMQAIKEHIELVLGRNVASARLDAQPLPWAEQPAE